jgi:hypothetical protein
MVRVLGMPASKRVREVRGNRRFAAKFTHPLLVKQPTQVGHHAESVMCQTATSNVQVTHKKKPPEGGLLNSNLRIADQATINSIASHTMSHIQPSVAVAIDKI